jgi:hypothetical protein
MNRLASLLAAALALSCDQRALSAGIMIAGVIAALALAELA